MQVSKQPWILTFIWALPYKRMGEAEIDFRIAALFSGAGRSALEAAGGAADLDERLDIAGAVRCGAVRCGAVPCDAAQRGAVGMQQYCGIRGRYTVHPLGALLTYQYFTIHV